MEKRLFIYRIRHLESGRAYIGWTINPEKRWRRHLGSVKSGGKNAIHCAIRLYGAAAFSFEIIEEITGSEADARAREIWWVASEGTLSPGGYNMTEGGDGADGLGKLAAAAHAARRALDVDADRKRRQAGLAKANAGMTAEARSLRGKLAWSSRSPEEKAKAAQRFEDHRRSLTPQQRSELGRKANLAGTTEERTARARKGAAALTSDQRRMIVAAMQAALTPEKRSEIGRLGNESKMRNTTAEQRSASSLKIWSDMTPEARASISQKQSAAWAAKSPEERADIARRRGEARRRNAASLKQLE